MENEEWRMHTEKNTETNATNKTQILYSKQGL